MNTNFRSCPACGGNIEHMHLNAVYCSNACRRWVANGNTEPRILILNCAECDGEIPNPKMGKKFCSRVCKSREMERRRVRDDRARYLQERDRRIKYATEYAKRNPHVAQATKVRRRAQKVANGLFRFNSKDWKDCLNRHGRRCFYCGSEEGLSMDHVIPLSRGGTHGPGNIVPACIPCNCQKQARTITEWKVRSKKGGDANVSATV